jgi:hypothetical protein
MQDPTRVLLAEKEGLDAETQQVLAELDAAFEEYTRSIDRGLALAAEMRQLADAIDAGLGDARAELAEWV